MTANAPGQGRRTRAARASRRLVPFLAAIAAVVLVMARPLAAVAHPLGNFTINHYAGLRVAPDGIDLDVVIDEAEIPTFQDRQRIDTDGDGQISQAELAAERSLACGRLSGSLALTVDSAPQSLASVAVGLSFPPGAGGLPIMRLVCEFRASFASRLSSSAHIRFEDRSNAERIGWREVVVQADGTTVSGDYPTASVSARLTAYPKDLLATPMEVRAVDFDARPGGPALAPWTAPDASALFATDEARAVGVAPGGGAPGGVGGEISGLFGTSDLTAPVLILSLLAAAALGAGHALTPGHGKSIMAAYLVGTRGSPRHAIGLGLATASSHTIGVLVLAGLLTLAGAALPADRIYPILSAASGLIVIAIGAWLLAGQVAGWRPRAGGVQPALGHAHDHDHAHDHAHGHSAAEAAQHHTHGPAPTSLSWRSLFALGLSGGLVPSTNALVILVATVAAGRPAYGVVLVIAFGLGMATVLVGLGIALVSATGWVARAQRGRSVEQILRLAPTLAAVAVMLLGLYLTQQAILGSRVL